MTLNTYEDSAKATWATFITNYRDEVVSVMEPRTADVVELAIKNFERLANPIVMAAIDANLIGAYVSARRKEPGKAENSTISAATLNRDLRTIKAMLRWAGDRKYLREMPKIVFARQMEKIPRVFTEAEFVAIYQACNDAVRPVLQSVQPGDWWRAFVVCLFTVGWRVSETLNLKWADVDLDAGVVRLKAENTKARREERVMLPPIVVEHLRKVRHFGQFVFEFGCEVARVGRMRPLYNEWHRLQSLAFDTTIAVRLPVAACADALPLR